MATTGTTAFTLDFADVAEEAYERCGLTLRSGGDLRTARRSLDLLLIEWINEGTLLWTVDEETQVLTVNDPTYTLTTGTVSVLEAVIRSGSGITQNDSTLDLMSRADYMAISNKNTTGPPSRLWVDYQRAAPIATLWPVPDAADTLVYYRMRRIEDTGSGGAYNPDVPFRFLPALISGLAAKLSEKFAPEREAGLITKYRETFDKALTADDYGHEFKFVPRNVYF